MEHDRITMFFGELRGCSIQLDSGLFLSLDFPVQQEYGHDTRLFTDRQTRQRRGTQGGHKQQAYALITRWKDNYCLLIFLLG